MSSGLDFYSKTWVDSILQCSKMQTVFTWVKSELDNGFQTLWRFLCKILTQAKNYFAKYDLSFYRSRILLVYMDIWLGQQKILEIKITFLRQNNKDNFLYKEENILDDPRICIIFPPYKPDKNKTVPSSVFWYSSSLQLGWTQNYYYFAKHFAVKYVVLPKNLTRNYTKFYFSRTRAHLLNVDDSQSQLYCLPPIVDGVFYPPNSWWCILSPQ